MHKFDVIISLLLAIPKTVYFNLKYFNFKDAIKFPVLVSHRVKLLQTKGKIIIDFPIEFGLIKIGLTEHMFADKLKCIWNVNGTIVFKGKTTLGNGFKIRSLGRTEFGENFSSTASLLIDCKESIVFGKDVLIGWNCTIMDTDNHYIKVEGETINEIRNIKIGDRVWIAANSSIMKGVNIRDDSVVASNTIVTKSINREIKSNVLVGGNPAKILRTNITWTK